MYRSIKNIGSILFFTILSNVSLLGQENKTKFVYGINIKGLGNFGYYFNDIELPPPYENWLDNFEPPSSDMQLSQEDDPNTLQFDIEFEPFIRFNNISVSFPFNNITSTRIATTYLEWHNRVPVNRLFLKKNLPQIRLGYNMEHFQFNSTFLSYKLMIKEYRGIDVVGGINYAVPIKKYIQDEGYGFKFEILYSIYKEPKYTPIQHISPISCIGVSYEHFNKYHHFGFQLSFGIDVIFIKNI